MILTRFHLECGSFPHQATCGPRHHTLVGLRGFRRTRVGEKRTSLHQISEISVQRRLRNPSILALKRAPPLRQRPRSQEHLCPVLILKRKKNFWDFILYLLQHIPRMEVYFDSGPCDTRHSAELSPVPFVRRSPIPEFKLSSCNPAIRTRADISTRKAAAD